MPRKGDFVKGKVTNIRGAGADMKLTTGEAAFLPIGEVHKDYVKDIRDYLSVGDEIEIKIIGRNKKNYSQFVVSLKQADRTERFEDMMSKWKKDSNDRNAAIQKSRDRKHSLKIRPKN